MSPGRPHPRRVRGRSLTVAPRWLVVAHVRTRHAKHPAHHFRYVMAKALARPTRLPGRETLLPPSGFRQCNLPPSGRFPAHRGGRDHGQGRLRQGCTGTAQGDAKSEAGGERHSARASASDLPIRHSTPLAAGDRAARFGGLGRLFRPPKEPGHPKGRRRAMPIRTMICRSTGLLPATRSAPPRRGHERGRAGTSARHQCLAAQRAHLPRRDVEELAAGRDRPRRRWKARGSRSRCSTSPGVTSEYGRHIHPCKACFSTAAAALPLAVLLLSEPFARPDPGLDERDLSDVGRRPRRDDHHAGELVPGQRAAQADDGPAGLRRRRQPRPDAHRGKDAAKAKAVELAAGTIRAISPAACSRWWCMATSREPRTSGARSPTGCAS